MKSLLSVSQNNSIGRDRKEHYILNNHYGLEFFLRMSIGMESKTATVQWLVNINEGRLIEFPR